MEKLTDAQRKNVGKMLDTRVVNVLARAGFSAEKLEGMDRPARLVAVAEIASAGENLKMPVRPGAVPNVWV